MAWGKKAIPVLAPVWDDKDMKAYNWCINNGVKISPWAASSERDNYFWWIDVNG